MIPEQEPSLVIEKLHNQFIELDLNTLELVRGSGGTYTPLYVCKRVDTGENVAVKQYGRDLTREDPVNAGSLTKPEIINLLIDSLRLRDEVHEGGFYLPEIYTWSHIQHLQSYEEAVAVSQHPLISSVLPPEEKGRLYIVEQYAGSNIKTLIRQLADFESVVYNDITLGDIIYEIRTRISGFRESVPLDTHPGNFTFLNGKIAFIDFIPPYPEQYRTNPRWVEIFPTLAKKEDFSDYHETQKRLARFDYYISKELERKGI